jgi:hypothetical protein
MQKSIFKIHGYHKELFDQHTGKYLGFIKMSVPDRSEAKFGYFGRTRQHVKGTAERSGKTFKVDGVYVTECIPLCGRIIADNVQGQHKVLQDHYNKTSFMRHKKS